MSATPQHTVLAVDIGGRRIKVGVVQGGRVLSVRALDARAEEGLTAHLADIEAKVAAAGKHTANAYFQHPSLGLTAPRNTGVEDDTAMPLMGRHAVRVSWDTAYAGDCSIERYEVLRDGEVVGTVPHQPQYTHRRFYYDDVLEDQAGVCSYRYQVVSVDASGTRAESVEIAAT